MTISSTTTQTLTTCNGTTTNFAFANKIFGASDLVATLIDTSGNLYAFTASGVNTFTNAATGLSYTVYNIDVDAGCFIVFSAAPTNLWQLDLRTAIAELQSTSIKNQASFYPELHEEFFDRITREMQDLRRLTYTYGIHGPDTESTAWTQLPNAKTRANLLLGFDSNGLPTTATVVSQTLTQSLIGQFLYPQLTGEVGVVNYWYAYGNVKRYGADPTGVTECSSNIQNADTSATALGISCYFPGGTYSVNWDIISRTGCNWLGDGKFTSVLKATTSSQSTNNTQLVNTNALNNGMVEKLGFDVSRVTFAPGTGNPGTLYWVLQMYNCSGWKVRDCSFTGIQQQVSALEVTSGSDFRIESCYFNCPSPSTHFNQAINVSVSAGATGAHFVTNNTCIGTGCFSNGGKGTWTGNNVTGANFGTGLGFGPLANCSLLVVANNNSSFNGTSGPDVNSTYPSGIEAWGTQSTYTANVVYHNGGAGFAGGAGNSIFSANFCADNGQLGSSSGGCGIANNAISSFGGSNSIFTGNQLYDDQGTPTQLYGYGEFNSGGTITGTLVYGNYTSGNSLNPYQLVSTSPKPLFTNGFVQGNGFCTLGKKKVTNNSSATYTFSTGQCYVGFKGTNVSSLTVNVRTGAGTVDNDGQRFTIWSAAAVTTFALTDGGFAAFTGFPTALTAGQQVSGIYDYLSNEWTPA